MNTDYIRYNSSWREVIRLEQRCSHTGCLYSIVSNFSVSANGYLGAISAPKRTRIGWKYWGDTDGFKTAQIGANSENSDALGPRDIGVTVTSRWQLRYLAQPLRVNFQLHSLQKEQSGTNSAATMKYWCEFFWL
jgi:hypothetical protein